MNYAKIVLFITFHIICIATNGQHDIGIKLAGGWSKISTILNSPQLIQEFKFMPSYQGGLSYNFHFKNKSIIGAELLFSKIEGKEHSEQSATDQYGNPTGQLITNDNSRHISYLSIPIYYGFNYKKLAVNIGMQSSFVISSNDLTTSSASDNNGNTLYFESKSDKLPIKNFDFGARAGVAILFNTRWMFEANYYYGLLNIYESNTSNWKWSVQQITIGVKYNIISSTETKN